MEFTHKGIKITLNESSGKFSATVDGKHISKPSLDAMKKHIDDSTLKTFEPFEAYDFDAYKLTILKVSEVQFPRKNARSWRSVPRWICAKTNPKSSWDRQSFERETVAEKTDANRDAIQAYCAYDKETDRIAAERSAEKEKLRAKIKYIAAADYKASKEAK